jgi:hypothetical protein
MHYFGRISGAGFRRIAQATVGVDPSENMLSAYSDGQRCKELYSSEREAAEYEIYNDGPFTKFVENPVLYSFWQEGFLGHDIPRWVTGWRYGHIPESGYSRNYRDDYSEPGVSVMSVEGMPDRGSKSYEMFNGGQEKVEVAGWLLGRHGSDGEYMLIGAEEI